MKGFVITDIMLFYDFLKARVIKLSELGQVMHVGYDVAQILLQEHEVVLGGNIVFFSCPNTSLTTLSRPSPFQATNNLIDFFLAGLDPSHNLSGFHPLECPDLVELTLQLSNKRLFIVFIPRPPL